MITIGGQLDGLYASSGSLPYCYKLTLLSCIMLYWFGEIKFLLLLLAKVASGY